MQAKAGAFEAKTHLPALLRRGEQGEEITITNRGRPVARLVSVEPAEKIDTRDVIEKMRAWREKHGPTLGEGLTIRDLIDESRRY